MAPYNAEGNKDVELVNADLLIVTGFNTDVNERLAEGIKKGEVPRYSPGINYSIIECPLCQADMWVGPKQLRIINSNVPNVVVRCLWCSLEEMNTRGAAETYTVSLGPDAPRRTT